MNDVVRLAAGAASAEVSPLGAELLSLKDSQGREWLWQGDAASWPRRAPVLFPVIGRCAGGVLRHQGRTYPMSGGHGFAPHRRFAIARRMGDRCRLRFESDAETRAAYPFDFRLEVDIRLTPRGLHQTALVTNTGDAVMPASIGFHPGFQWPLPSVGDASATDHLLLFETAEPAPVRRLADHLLAAAPKPSPIQGRHLVLSPTLFAEGALIFDRLVSRKLWFGVPGRPGLRIDFPDLPHLGLWMLPGARFLCIEPWQGHACPEGFTGDILAKPGMIHLAPGESFSRSMVVAPRAPPF